MSKNNIFILGIIVAVVAVGFIFRRSQIMADKVETNQENQPVISNKVEKEINTNEKGIVAKGEFDVSRTVYYYGDTCPHCEKVLDFLDENDIYNKVDFTKKEVYRNKANSAELTEAAQKCGMNPANIGVPFVFSEGKCYIGDADVIKLFSQKAGLEEKK